MTLGAPLSGFALEKANSNMGSPVSGFAVVAPPSTIGPPLSRFATFISPTTMGPPFSDDVFNIIGSNAESNLLITHVAMGNKEIYATSSSIMNLNAQSSGGKDPKLVSAETTIELNTQLDSFENYICVEATTSIKFKPMARVFRNIYILFGNNDISFKENSYQKTNKGIFAPTRRTQIKMKNISGQTLQIRLITSQKILIIPPNDVVTVNINELDFNQIAKLRNEYLLSAEL